MARAAQPCFEVKGRHPLTENYSVLSPEVLDGPDGRPIAHKNEPLIARLLSCDAVIVAGQAKSHCVAWTVRDLLAQIEVRDPGMAGKVYLLEDCTSPVVVPGAVDFTEQADDAYRDFSRAGMHLVRSVDRIDQWPGWPS